MLNFSSSKVIAAVGTDEKLRAALGSNVDMIFCLNANILSLKEVIDSAHSSNKKIFVHMDLTEGIGRDAAGILYAKQLGADGIITTRAALVKSAHEAGLLCVQRFFIMDSRSVEVTLDSVKSSKADMIEIMPGVIPKIIDKIRKKTELPVIAGGIIENAEEAEAAFSNGANAISTGCDKLWDLKHKGDEL